MGSMRVDAASVDDTDAGVDEEADVGIVCEVRWLGGVECTRLGQRMEFALVVVESDVEYNIGVCV